MNKLITRETEVGPCQHSPSCLSKAGLTNLNVFPTLLSVVLSPLPPPHKHTHIFPPLLYCTHTFSLFPRSLSLTHTPLPHAPPPPAGAHSGR